MGMISSLRILPFAIITTIIGVLLLAVWWQHSAMNRLARELGELTAANSGLAISLSAAEEGRRRDNTIIAEAATAAQELQNTARNLQYQLKEALKHETQFNLDSPLPVHITDALCLRWQAASGYSEDNAGNAAAGAHARTRHTAPGICSASDGGLRPPGSPQVRAEPSSCASSWRNVTLYELFEWTGALLDHAGLERLDKAALRKWAGGNQ
jgi:hypothetical protein